MINNVEKELDIQIWRKCLGYAENDMWHCDFHFNLVRARYQISLRMSSEFQQNNDFLLHPKLSEVIRKP